ncbi:hypothetical protein Zmor_013679 [Zophobas morio]|uniref:Uncharacterized protein n=1 Tax=Zophobas morio TaxID=2755281 RepID=A0AA38IB08_9CUCU|nr:hypothetical protein Zmor_013679 [Zophobas morio]
MLWYQEDEEEENLMFSPALMARRASESWIDTPPVENLVPQSTTLQRKKSLPDFQDLPRSTGAMSREEVSYLGSARREEVRRQHEETERLRANPLLYLVSPQVKVNPCWARQLEPMDRVGTLLICSAT